MEAILARAAIDGKGQIQGREEATSKPSDSIPSHVLAPCPPCRHGVRGAQSLGVSAVPYLMITRDSCKLVA
jgi:hypothetical protein